MGESILQTVVRKHGAAAVFKGLSAEQKEIMLYNWAMNARPEQLAPGGVWNTWLVLSGRGWGKSRTGAEWVRQKVKDGARRIAFIASTAADARDVMIEGESGIMNCGPPDERPKYEPSKRRLTWPNGAVASIFSSEKPDRLRGPQFDLAWGDELGSWYIPPATSNDKDPLDMLYFGLRLGNNPQAIFTTTPRPTKHIKGLLKDKNCVVTKGSTYDNRANLADSFFEKIIEKYEGTRLGRQEIYAEVLDDNPDAMFSMVDIDNNRIREISDRLTLERVVVALDPAAKSLETSDDTGIVACAKGDDGHYYILEDNTCHETPSGWAKEAVKTYNRNSADRLVGETNNGGEMIEAVLRTESIDISYQSVTASRGKAIRAEPIAALYEQGKVHHVGAFAQLEDEMCSWSPLEDRYSPNRLDALVWGLSALSGVNNASIIQTNLTGC